MANQGRLPQHDAEFFPFYAKDGRTLFLLQEVFGLEGIGFFTNLLRLLCTTPHHHVDLSDPNEAMYTWAKIGMKGDVEKAEKMLSIMVKTGKIDRELWEKYHVVYSQDFVDSLAPLYAKRKEKPTPISDIRGIYCIPVTEKPIPGDIRNGNTASSQFPVESIRKGEERIVSIVSKGEPPTPKTEGWGVSSEPDYDDLPALAIPELQSAVTKCFQAKNPIWPNMPRQVEAIRWLCDAFKVQAEKIGSTPENVALTMIERFWELKNSGRDFFRKQPFEPKMMESLWGQILAETEQSADVSDISAFDGLL